ncbi:unnamed protein product [Prunus armeniaca]
METQKDGQLTFLEAWATHQISHTRNTKQHGNLMGSSGNWEQLGMGVLHQPKGSTKLHSINREMYTHSKGSHSIQPKIHLSHPLTLPSFPRHSIQPQITKTAPTSLPSISLRISSFSAITTHPNSSQITSLVAIL